MSEPTETKQPEPTVRPAARQRVPWWASHPPTLAVAAMILVVAELAAFKLCGVLVWLIANTVLVVVVFAAALAWRRRTGGTWSGLLGRLLPGRRAGGSSAARHRSASAGTASRGGGLGGRLGRMFGGGRAGSGRPAGGSRTGPAGGTSGRGLLGRVFGRRTAAAGRAPGGAPASGRRAGGSGRGIRGLLGGASKKTGRGGEGGSSRRRVGLLGRGRKGTSAAAADPSSKRTAKSGRTATGAKAAKVSKWNPLSWRGWTPTGNTKATPDSRKLAAEIYGKTKPQHKTEEKKAPEPHGGPRHTKPAVPVPRPADQRTTAQRSPGTMPTHKDDSSLQAWGKSLKVLAPALQELDQQHRRVAAANKGATEALQKIAQQADSDLPVSNVITAEVQSIAQAMKKLDAEAEAAAAQRRALIARAEALPATYRREHETDEDRLNTPRKSRAAEKRADVTTAEQDT